MVLPWVLLLAKVPLCFWCLSHWFYLSSTTEGWFKSLVGCGFKSLCSTPHFPLVSNSPICAVLRTYELRNLRSSLTSSIHRNHLCCLGCQLMSNRFAQLAVGIRFWMNCAVCAVERSTRCLPEGKGSPGRRLSCSLGWLNGLGVAGELYHDLLDAGLSPFACSRSGAVRWVAAWSFRPYRRWACSFILAAGCGLAGLPDRVRVLRPVLAVVGWQVCRFGCGVAVMVTRTLSEKP